MKFPVWTILAGAALCTALAGCGGDGAGGSVSGGATGTTTPVLPPLPAPTEFATTTVRGQRVGIAPIATMDVPWAVNFLPDGRMLVTEAYNGLRLVTQYGVVSQPADGLPTNLNVPFDVLASPNFTADRKIYLSYGEMGEGATRLTRDGKISGQHGLAVLTATLDTSVESHPLLRDVKVIWRQLPKVEALGEYGGKLAFSPDGKYLFVTTGDRSTFGPSQQLDSQLGKTIRLFPDGSIPPDNPSFGKSGLAAEMWSLGHRNAYGIAFAPDGLLWENEHGPKGGDEFNLIDFGANYGWPTVSSGDNYDGGLIRKPALSDPYNAGVVVWTPAIAPAGLIFYKGSRFTAWLGEAISGGLQAKGLVFVKTSGRTAAEVDRLPLGARIRDVREAPDGAIWVLEDAPTGRLLRLTPVG